jgi:hypothetical protein
VILAPEDDAAQGALGSVVVERQARVIQEAEQARPEIAHVRDGLAQRAAR